MNRVIKFRGKAIEPSLGWIYGDLIQLSEVLPVIQRYEGQMLVGGEECKRFSQDKVHPETVGQFTGFYDRKGQEIYESDIITYLNHRMDGTGFIEQGKVEWRQEEGCYVFVNRFPTKDNRELVMPLIHCKEITVVGNIHDNPELLEGGEK